MSIAALFTTARTWKQPRCPLADKWVMTMCSQWNTQWNITVIKQNETDSFAVRWMNLQPVTQREVTQKEKNKY